VSQQIICRVKAYPAEVRKKRIDPGVRSHSNGT
jgi:hypothetical protein